MIVVTDKYTYMILYDLIWLYAAWYVWDSTTSDG